MLKINYNRNWLFEAVNQMSNKKPVIELLNKLGPLFHSHFAIHPEKDDAVILHYSNKINELKDAFSEGHEIFDEKNAIEITNNQHLKINKEYCICYNYDTIKKESLEQVSYKTVIIKYTNENYWSKLPEEWYNMPSKWWKGYFPYLKPYVLPYLKSRAYIKINKPFMEVEVSAAEKGIPLTIDDILFATRALMWDDCRSVDGGYTILSKSNDILIIEPNIDNWSS